jgi:hypothetical protein
MRIIYYLTFVFTVWAVQDILLHFPGKGQDTLYNAIIFISIGLIFVAYAGMLYLQWREKNPGRKYPSTVQAKLKQGYEAGLKKR